MPSTPIAPPLPFALAASTDSLTTLGAGAVWEAKWDGFRAQVWSTTGRVFSRRGTDLTASFPEVAAAARSRLDPGLLLDGELVAWDLTKGRLDFATLQSRLGRRAVTPSASRPVHFVAFDVLAIDGHDVRPLPLRDRRTRLERLLAGSVAPITVCQQTDDETQARRWLLDLVAGGIEGLVIKNPDDPYPTRETRVWRKLKATQPLDLIVIGATGSLSAPTSLLLATRPSHGDELYAAGSTTVLSQTAARAIGRLLTPTGQTVSRRFAWTSDTSEVSLVEPVVVEVNADVAVTTDGTLRHGAKLLRIGPDLDPADIDTALT